MKRNALLFSLFAAICCLNACAPKPHSDVFVIKGVLDGLTVGDTLVVIPLEYCGLDAEAVGSSAVAADGHFCIEGTVTEPRMLCLGVKGSMGFERIMVEGGQHASVTGKVEKSISPGSTRCVFTAEIEGSSLTDEFNAKYAKRDELDAMYDAIEEQYADIRQQLNDVYADKEAYDALRQTPEVQAYYQAQSDFLHFADSVLTGIMIDNGDTFWGPIMVYALTAYISPDMKSVYDGFSDAAKNTLCGQALCEELYPTGQVGSLAKDFTTTAADGAKTSLSSLCEGKKLIFLDFWASWCGPCRRELPNVKAIYDKHHAAGFEVISISIDDDETAWLKAVDEEALVWPNFRDRAVADLYKVKAVPTMYLLDGTMHVVGLDLRGQELAERVDELMSR